MTVIRVLEVGTRVRIRDIPLNGHYRIPHYVRNRVGHIERYCGAFPNPEEVAYGKSGLPAIPLYRVRIQQVDIWPDYPGPTQDTLDIEVYDHWLDDCGRLSHEQQ